MLKIILGIFVVMLSVNISNADNNIDSKVTKIATVKAGDIELIESDYDEIFRKYITNKMYLNGKPINIVNKAINKYEKIYIHRVVSHNDSAIIIFDTIYEGGSDGGNKTTYIAKITNDKNAILNKLKYNGPTYIDSEDIRDIKVTDKSISITRNTNGGSIYYVYDMVTNKLTSANQKIKSKSQESCKDLYNSYTNMTTDIDSNKCNSNSFPFGYFSNYEYKNIMSLLDQNDNGTYNRFVKICNSSCKKKKLYTYNEFESRVCRTKR